jgi:hypothetical protein
MARSPRSVGGPDHYVKPNVSGTGRHATAIHDRAQHQRPPAVVHRGGTARRHHGAIAYAPGPSSRVRRWSAGAGRGRHGQGGRREPRGPHPTRTTLQPGPADASGRRHPPLCGAWCPAGRADRRLSFVARRHQRRHLATSHDRRGTGQRARLARPPTGGIRVVPVKVRWARARRAGSPPPRTPVGSASRPRRAARTARRSRHRPTTGPPTWIAGQGACPAASPA